MFTGYDRVSILSAIEQGDHTLPNLLPLVYEELPLAAAKLSHEKRADAANHGIGSRGLSPARRGRAGSASASRGHFFAAAAEAMRRILVEKARRKKRLRHGGGLQKQPLDENELDIAAPVDAIDLLALDEALNRLEATSARRAQLVKLRYFAGFTLPEVAEMLAISQSTVEADWTYAKAWLKREMEKT